MRAILCPGQGSQRSGMLSPWLDDGATPQSADTQILGTTRQFLTTLSEAAGLDLLSLGTRADETAIRDTAVAQPLVVATSLVSARAAGLLTDDDATSVRSPHPNIASPSVADTHHSSVTVGHSLGALTALAIAGVITAAQSVSLAAIRGRAMARCAQNNPGTMVAIIGGARDEVTRAVETAGLIIANVNGAQQIVASGSLTGVERLRRASLNGARVVPLPVAGAFHSPAMADAAGELEVACTALMSSARNPRMALIDDSSGEIFSHGMPALASLVTKLTAPVRWDLVEARLVNLGLSDACELAPAGTLSGLARTGLPQVKCTRLDSPERVEAWRARR